MGSVEPFYLDAFKKSPLSCSGDECLSDEEDEDDDEPMEDAQADGDEEVRAGGFKFAHRLDFKSTTFPHLGPVACAPRLPLRR